MRTIAFRFVGTVVFRGMSHLPSSLGPSKGGLCFHQRGFDLSSGASTASPLKFVHGIDFGGMVKMWSTRISLYLFECFMKLRPWFVVSSMRSPRLWVEASFSSSCL